MYKFKVEMYENTVLKERIVFMLFMGLYFFLLYGSVNYYSSISGPHPSLFMNWEMNIPFIDYLIIPYMSSDIIFGIVFLLAHTRQEIRLLAFRSLYIITFSVLIFLIFPLQYGFEKPIPENGLFLFELLKNDLPYNQLPSLHISFSIVLWYSVKRFLNPFFKIIVFSWFVLICISTLFVYQHHFIDLPTGFLMGLSAIYFINKDSWFINQFSTPRSIKMGFYYLITSVILILIIFNINNIYLKVLLLWGFVSFLSISIMYTFGIKEIIINNEGKSNIFQYILFFPYFSLNYLGWFYFKHKLPLLVHVKDNVYLGRFPDKKEFQLLSDLNIKKSINLTSEQQLKSGYKNQIRLPLLDQTIHSPSYLHKIVKEIEKEKNENVYIHCSLGLSRSIIVIGAWLIYNGYKIEEVFELFNKIRPQYIKSPYMKINLELYFNHLKLIRSK